MDHPRFPETSVLTGNPGLAGKVFVSSPILSYEAHRRSGPCVLVLARPISAKYSKLTVSVLRRAVMSVSQTNAIAGTTGELAQYP